MRIVDHIETELQKRKTHSTFRTLQPRQSEERLCNLADNDYLHLSRHPKVIQAATDAAQKWGCSSSASPLVTGYTQAHKDLEDQLCHQSGFPHALVWNTGYAANHALLHLLPQKEDTVLADKLIHNSMLSGLMANQAKMIRYPHLDLDRLEELLKKQEKSCFVVTESVFSMDGDFPDLQKMGQLKEKYGFFWIVDEAHATGWYGQKGMGMIDAFKLQKQVDIVIGTLGKAVGSMGAYTLFQNENLRDYCINFAGEFIYSTYLSPISAAAALQALQMIEEQGEAFRKRLQQFSIEFRKKIAPLTEDPSTLLNSNSPIVPLILKDADKTLRVAKELLDEGFKVGAIRPPTVPRNTSRLRISLNSELASKNKNIFPQILERACR